jgi:alkanesulfonate monooxygenase SsuD/methylene tetrahydromethanopterin reductase-like flavin-dependent oxidoreductase (luciferase family)
MKIGLTLPNRGVLFGAVTVDQMLRLAELADAGGQFESVWVGDSLLGKPRLESIALLAAIAGRTRRVRLGTACMASFPLRDPVLLAYQWGSLDVIAGGRTVLVVCTGIVPQEGGRVEGELYGLQPRDRVRRMIEWIRILRLLWTGEPASFEGEHYRFQDVVIEPRPAARPHPPIWIANNAVGDRSLVERTHRRVARHADGWETSLSDLDDLAWRLADVRAKLAEEGRDPAGFETHLYHNVNINEDEHMAYEESRQFLEQYYSQEFPPERVRSWCALGSPERCVEHLLAYRRLGFSEVTLRITSWDQEAQFERLTREVLPALAAAAAA